MQFLRGSLAHTHFRLERLLTKINYSVPHVHALSSEFVYFIDSDETLSKEEDQILSDLLNLEIRSEPEGILLLVVPKVGIHSIWGKNAQIILHNCGLKRVRSIERGIAYYVLAQGKLTWGDIQAIAHIVHDSKTESVLYHFEDATSLFKLRSENHNEKIEIPIESTASVVLLGENEYFNANQKTHQYEYNQETLGMVINCDRKNTAYEMKEELAIGYDVKLKATFNGFNVANFPVSGFLQPGLSKVERPKYASASLEFMIEMPEREAEMNNEIGRPNICGYFHTHNNFTEPTIITGGMSYVRIQDLKRKAHPEEIFSPAKEFQPSPEDSQPKPTEPILNTYNIELEEAIERILKHPSIADKSFLVTLCDRSVTGLVSRDQLIGPWQIPVADCAVVSNSFIGNTGIGFSLGERSTLNWDDRFKSARMSVCEALLNLAGVTIGSLSDIRLYLKLIGKECVEVIQALNEFCLNLGLKTPKMKHSPQPDVNPSFIISAYTQCLDVRKTITPYLNKDEETSLIYIDLSGGHQRLGASAIAEVYGLLGGTHPDCEDVALMKGFFSTLQQLSLEEKILAYHDRSEGGLFVTLAEMSFASHVGLDLDISELGVDPINILFNEELGAVIQVPAYCVEYVRSFFADNNVPNTYIIGNLNKLDKLVLVHKDEIIFSRKRSALHKTWSLLNYHLHSLRDNPRSAKKQYELIDDETDPGLNDYVTFDFGENCHFPFVNVGAKPKVAIIRERGTLGHIEMAAAFDKALFEAIDVHLDELFNGTITLNDFKGFAIGSGFSYADVLGAGVGFAKRILFNHALKDQFQSFFARTDTFSLGVANGCQVLSQLKSIIPGSELWPMFIQNFSEQFECRLCLVEVQESPSILLKGMAGARLLIPVAHKEGRAEFENETFQDAAIKQNLVTLRYVDNRGRKTKIYPANPNGSPLGITALTTTDGRCNIMMPHPERGFRTNQYSWTPNMKDQDAPWVRLFQNARQWVG